MLVVLWLNFAFFGGWGVFSIFFFLEAELPLYKTKEAVFHFMSEPSVVGNNPLSS